MKNIGISKLFDAISLNFEIAKIVLYKSFVQDSAFRKFINSNLDFDKDNKYFMIDFYRTSKFKFKERKWTKNN